MSGRSPLYDDPELAASYARVTAANAANAAYERPAVRALLGEVRGLDVLDAGCAAGEHSAWLVENGARVVAVDGSEAMVRLARERLDRAGGARVLQADLAEPLPFADASFDVVLSSLTLHYLADWSGPFGELARVLRGGGRLVFSIHHPFMTAADVADYHGVSLIEETWKGFAERPVPVRFYHRPLQRVLDDVLGAGFTLRGVVEPQPTAEADARDPQLAARFRTEPGFLIVDAEKPAR
ncbi:MAG TPA: class I SAM-dependent methyltransferase [Candidatus Limnocylindrales bacterium]|nr:class I SAM-dependent methyltransferase [Candidatus Limnocylindrales bacterium]